MIALRPSLQAARTSEVPSQQAFVDAQRVLDAKYAKLLEGAKAAIEAKESALQQIREELLTGYVVAKDIDVTDSNRAYWLSEPKLMLGVNGLSGGSLLISFADQTEMISVGERIDFKVDECDCFLLLKSSDFGNASFRYACSPSSNEPRQKSRNPIIDARLN
ncbi:hypothetical protein ACOTTU_00025 [Roseobacter sp. EG26]|uniref:hypothetical protein n=1 Tax=Roseobacter sp. EG26 TaxID=3412477 RepID=UPI003CE54FF6